MADSPEHDPLSVIAQALRDHARELRAFVAARTPASEVDDVLQTAAMRAVSRAHTLRDPGRVLSWLYRLHRNIITDTLRAQARADRVIDRVQQLPDRVSDPNPGDTCRCSLSQMEQMRPGYAAVLSLVDLENAPLAEVAETLGISVNNVSVRLHRARKALRKAMREHCGVENARDCFDCSCVENGCCPT